jgi:hypothetical protein
LGGKALLDLIDEEVSLKERRGSWHAQNPTGWTTVLTREL